MDWMAARSLTSLVRPGMTAEIAPKLNSSPFPVKKISVAKEGDVLACKRDISKWALVNTCNGKYFDTEVFCSILQHKKKFNSSLLVVDEEVTQYAELGKHQMTCIVSQADIESTCWADAPILWSLYDVIWNLPAGNDNLIWWSSAPT